MGARAAVPSTLPVAATYTNPLNVALADPFVIRHDGMYYVYGTTAATTGFHAWSSPDLVHWEPRGLAFTKTEKGWGRNMFWAPCVVEHDGAFYLYYSALGNVGGGKKTSLRICAARSNSPLGPFSDVKAPLVDPGKAVIDVHVLIDSDGRGYLYYVLDLCENGVSEVYVVPLGSDLISVTGSPKMCVRPDQPWEGGKWNEGPFVFKHNSTYILMYSAHAFLEPEYAVGYASAPSPLGPWTKAADNPLLHRTANVTGPGHNCVIASPDGSELFIVYHAHKRGGNGYQRELAIDRLTIDEDAAGAVHLHTDGPTRDPRPMPSARKPDQAAALIPAAR